MKLARAIKYLTCALLALAAIKLVINQRAIDKAFRDHLARQARLELRLARLNAETVLARQRHDALSARVDRIDARR